MWSTYAAISDRIKLGIESNWYWMYAWGRAFHVSHRCTQNSSAKAVHWWSSVSNTSEIPHMLIRWHVPRISEPRKKLEVFYLKENLHNLWHMRADINLLKDSSRYALKKITISDYRTSEVYLLLVRLATICSRWISPRYATSDINFSSSSAVTFDNAIRNVKVTRIASKINSTIMVQKIKMEFVRKHH